MEAQVPLACPEKMVNQALPHKSQVGEKEQNMVKM